ncbi:hypothetical protein JTE90_016663 [Oedothorax gibbosus]|uniref:Ribosomal L1 domain-containing protein 1 n=1 Tax=Oedothorax gibbosus TaxID=931172 RepID=A0AAV6V5G6_9ARAC|nr:hypothetical protein JTE90_016663 [Oedothorax gibbosus]
MTQLPKKRGKSKKGDMKESGEIAEENTEKCAEGNTEKCAEKNTEKCAEENVENIEPIIKNVVAEPQEISKKSTPKVEPFQIQRKPVKEAISVLKKLNEHHSASKDKKPLLDDIEENPVYLQVQLHKIPPKLAKQMIKIKLPHPLLTDTSEVCLITGDLDKKDKKSEIEPTVLHYKELLKKLDVKGITQVVPLRQLRTEYKTFEAKRQLSAAYDVFLCDRKICGVLPKLLGKAFYKKRKFPIEINMDTKNVKEQVENALSKIVFTISCHGTSCASEVARLSMEDDEILENILASVETLIQKISGKTKNIQGLYIKTARSEAIPIYMSYDFPGRIRGLKRRRERGVEEEELSTLPNRKVKVYQDGRVRVIRTDNDSDEESKVRPEFKTEELPPKSHKIRAGKKNKSKKRKIVKDVGSAAE